MEKRYFCIKVKQRIDADAPEFVVFVANAKDITDWVGIRRVGENENGIQRVLKPPRVKAIKRYFESNPHNTIPVSAVIAFDPNTAVFEDLNDQVAAAVPGTNINNGLGQNGRWGVLTFNYEPGTPEDQRPAIVVDGQHRLKGMAASNDEIPIGVAAYIGIAPQEQAFQFVVINNKAQKVDTKNVKAIIRNVDEDLLERRLLKAGVSYGKYPATLGDIDELEESPFYQMLDWPLNPTDNKKVYLQVVS